MSITPEVELVSAGQRFNEVAVRGSGVRVVGYQYLPFEVYARSHFRSATADAYTWSAAKQAYDRAKRARTQD